MKYETWLFVWFRAAFWQKRKKVVLNKFALLDLIDIVAAISSNILMITLTISRIYIITRFLSTH